MEIITLRQADENFPGSLVNIPQPPKQLFVIGDIKLLSAHPMLAVVGSRKLSPYGRAVSEDLVQRVANLGMVIVSGLALGVDAIAHRAALSSGARTIAVLPCGLDKPYPATNRQLARDILREGGALVSEYPEGTPPMQHHFIERNRIVSGLSDGVLITEAREKSGTIHTAGFALDQGKTVMAVPGNITSELSVGTNNLIKTGAMPVTNAQDILSLLGVENQHDDKEVLAANEAEAAILSLMKQGLTEGNDLQLQSGLNATVFNQTLTMLEITGKVHSIGAGHWTLG